MNPLKNCIATSTACLALLALGTAQALAGEAIGSVTLLDGPLLVKRQSGAIKALALNSLVERGDMLVSESATYAQIQFTDKTEITLKPNTSLKVESYAFNGTVGDGFDTIFSVSKGAVQVKSGVADLRSSANIRLVMPNLLETVASVRVKGESGATFVAEFIPSTSSQLAIAQTRMMGRWAPPIVLAMAEPAVRSDGPLFFMPSHAYDSVLLAQGPTPGSGTGLAPGLYVHVIDGLIQLSNRGGVQQFAAGQFGFTGSIVQPPVIVPNNPGIQFNPPPAFSSSSGPRPSGSASGDKPKTVDCEVR
jgi:hypothetical protein